MYIIILPTDRNYILHRESTMRSVLAALAGYLDFGITAVALFQMIDRFLSLILRVLFFIPPPSTVERTHMKTTKSILALCTFLVIFSRPTLALSQNPPSAVKDTISLSQEDEVNAWHQKRIASLKRPQGWLSLVALEWLKEGQNTVESIGTLTLNKGVVTLQVLPGVQAKVGGNPFSSGILRIEGGKERPDRVEVSSRTFVIIRRGDRYAVRMWDSNSETLKKFSDIARFPVSKQWRVEARWEPYASPKPIKVASVIPGYLEDYNVPGVATFSVGGQEYTLEPVGSGTETLFFIFADKTNGKETYGAGRFLYADPPKEGKVVIDFNKAHNPPCAFTPYATCPLPPESNRLTVRIEAGEKTFGDH